MKRTYVVLIAIFLACFTTPGWAAVFSFSTGNPDGKLGALSQQASPENNQIETETADDFILSDATVINSATITGLIPLGTSLTNITNVEVELYHVFPKDSDVGRTSGPPTFSTANVPTRVNSPADVEIGPATRDGSVGTLMFSSSLLNSSFMVSETVVEKIAPKAGSDGPATGEEVQIAITFTPPIVLPAPPPPLNHYFFRPEAQVTGGNFLYLSAPRSLNPPLFAGDLQAWIRNTNLKPDWLRIGTDIIDGSPAPTFNMTFSLSGNTVPNAGVPGQANCHGKTISALATQFGDLDTAAVTLGFSSVAALQAGIGQFCEIM